MTTKTYTCTLTRWHKVSERLAKEYTQLTKAVKKGLTETTVPEYLGEAQEARLIEQRTTCLGNLERAFEIQDSVAHIRQAVGTANEHEGVSLALTEYDKLVKRVGILSSLIDTGSESKVAIAEIKNIKTQQRAEGFLSRGSSKIEVGMLDSADRVRIKGLVDEATATMYAKADAIAELNKSKLSLDLPTAIAKIAGL